MNNIDVDIKALAEHSVKLGRIQMKNEISGFLIDLMNSAHDSHSDEWHDCLSYVYLHLEDIK